MATSASDNALHLWRSRTIDAFARAEAVVDALSQKLNVSTKVDMLGAKIEAVRKAQPNTAVNEDKKKKIDQLLSKLSGVVPLRNDLVHSPMIIEKVGEHAFATFANPNLKCSFSTFKRVIPANQLQALAAKVTQVAESLEKC
ncbi:hypothetical protein [Novosphingobium sp. CECT 9465]|uniref:hypothetical protein n=1 Tax=Novosphingobium sp. CECT 9465 TaxID=2829794 RepID=UPI001E2C8005|nr:hypothetical protein [Novosphingobium sp. CECT 9465]